MIDASCMKEDGMFSTLNFWRKLGKRRWMNGLADQNVIESMFNTSIILTMFYCLAKLPKWFGERPGKKPGEPESPDDEDDGAGDAPAGAIDEEEEEEEEEEE